jgi:cyclophilin family peptidyl-prolyl cis-trans isomerase
MARQGDPIERQGAMPRSEAANSAGSQFFICLDYKQTMQLDGRYTAFGKVVQGMDYAQEIAKTPTEPKIDKPLTPQTIQSIRVFPVTAGKYPYGDIISITTGGPTTKPDAP